MVFWSPLTLRQTSCHTGAAHCVGQLWGGLAPGKDLSLDGTGWNRVHRAGAGEDLGFYMDIKCE